MSNCNASPHETQVQPSLIIQNRDHLYDFIDACPRSQTFTAYSDELHAEILIPVGCKTWSCWYCARVKIAKLAAQTREAKPNRMLTLTIDPSLWDSPRAAFDGTRRKVPELIKRLRKRFGTIEYLRVTELTKKGWPHYHLLLRSNFLPQPVVAKEWRELTGAKIVDLRQVKATFKAYSYLVKYLSKLHTIEWTERHVSYSKNFFPPYEPKERTDYRYERKQMVNAHPVTVCLTYYPGHVLTHVENQIYQISLPPDPWSEN